MELGRRFIVDMNAIFRTRPREVYDAAHIGITTDRTSFGKGNVYSKFLIAETNPVNSSYEIPLIMREYSEDALDSNHTIWCYGNGQVNTNKLVFPLYLCGPKWIKSTFDSVIRCFFSYTKPADRICSVELKQSNLLWHGGRGIIMDKDFNILLLITIVIERDPGTFKYNHARTLCRLNPKIFPTKDLMSRGIVNKIIPFFTQERVMTSYLYNRSVGSFTTSHTNIGSVSVVVDPNINRFIESPKAPYADTTDEELHQCIIDNKMEILKMIQMP